MKARTEIEKKTAEVEEKTAELQAAEEKLNQQLQKVSCFCSGAFKTGLTGFNFRLRRMFGQTRRC